MRTNIQLATTLNNDYPNRNGDVIYVDNVPVVYLSHRVIQTPSGIGSRTMLVTYYKVITINGEAEVNDIASFIRPAIRTVSE